MPTLSESQSKSLLHGYGVPIAREEVTHSAPDAAAAAARIGFPVVAKLGGASIAHKTERGLVKLNLRDTAAVETAAAELLGKARPEDGDVHVLIAQQVSGIREFIAGVVRDAQFGPCVMLGVGGVLAEALADVAFRPVPLTRIDADELISDLKSQALLGPLRGEPAVDRERLIDALVGLGQAAVDDPSIQSIDVNPLIVSNGVPIAVDALVEVSATPATEGANTCTAEGATK